MKHQIFLFPPIPFTPIWLVLNRTQSLKNYPGNCRDTSKRRKTVKLIAAISFKHYNKKTISAAVWECHHKTEQRNTLQGKQDTGMQLAIRINFLVQGDLVSYQAACFHKTHHCLKPLFLHSPSMGIKPKAPSGNCPTFHGAGSGVHTKHRCCTWRTVTLTQAPILPAETHTEARAQGLRLEALWQSILH